MAKNRPKSLLGGGTRAPSPPPPNTLTFANLKDNIGKNIKMIDKKTGKYLFRENYINLD